MTASASVSYQSCTLGLILSQVVGGYCTGVAGARIRLTASDVGINYQLVNSGGPVGSALGGVGGTLDFGLLPAGTYSVTATNATTGCKII